MLGATTQLVDTLEQIRKAFILDAFNNLLASDDVAIVRVDKAGEVLMGRQRSPRYDQGISPRPYLRVANVYDGYIDTTDVKQMDFSDAEVIQYLLKPGDVLLVEGHSSAEVVGRSTIFRNEVPGACFQNTLLRFRPDSVSSEYSHQYFRYCLLTRRFSQTAKQTTIAHLGATRFAQMPFPIPSGSWEQKIVAGVLAIEQSRMRATTRRADLQRLRTEIMHVNMMPLGL